MLTHKPLISSNSHAAGRPTGHLRRARQQLVPGRLRPRAEGRDAASRCAIQPEGPLERARATLPHRADVAWRKAEGLRQRARLQLALGSGLSAQPYGHGAAMSVAASRAGGRCQGAGYAVE